MNFDELLKFMGDQDRVYDHERLGRFSSLSGLWRLNSKVDFPFQKDVEVTFELKEECIDLPESMPRNIHWVEENLGEIWNAAAAVVNATIESERLQMPPQFLLHHLWVFIPDAPLQSAEWRIEIEVIDVFGSFEVVFCGLKVVRHALL